MWRAFLTLVLSGTCLAQATITGGVTLQGNVTMSAGVNQGQLLGENAYCGAGDVANFGGTDAGVTLPTSCTNTALANTPSPGSTFTVASDCSNLQSVVNSAACGSIIKIPATTTCNVNSSGAVYTFANNCNASNWTTVETDQVANAAFPAEGVQATPCQINLTSVYSYPNYPCTSPATLMPSIVSNATNVVAIKVTGSYYRFIGLNVTKGAGISVANDLVQLNGSDHVILDRMLVHGIGNDFKTKSGVSFRGTHQAIVSSWIYDIDYNSPDGYPVSGGTGTQSDEGPHKIWNTLLGGGSEAFIYGGGETVSVPHDIEIRHNLLMKPLKYFEVIGQAVGSSNSNYVNIKNLGELKIGTRVFYEDNVASWDWQGQSDQPGSMWNWNPSAQSSFSITGFINTNGTTVNCATNAGGTACSAGAGWFAVNITSGSRTSNVVTLNATAGSQGWPGRWNPPYHVVVQGITGTCSSFNGEQIITNLNNSGVVQFTLSGSDIPSCGSTTGAIITDLIATTCAPNGCKLNVNSTAAYPPYHIASVQSSEQLTLVENVGTNTGVVHRTCFPGLTPNAVVSNVVARYNYLSHASAVGLGMQNGTSDCGDANAGSTNASVHDIVWDDVDASFWTNELNACCAGGTGAGSRIGNGFTNSSTWQSNLTYAHISGMGLRTWTGGGLGAGGIVMIDSLVSNTAITNLQRASNVATITVATNTFAVGNTIQVSGFTGSYAGLNGTNLTVTATTATTLSYANTGTNIPSTPVSSGTTGSGIMNAFPFTYWANLTFKDSFLTAPFNWVRANGNTVTGGVVGGFSQNACNPSGSANCTWKWTNIVQATAMYAGFTQASAAPYPASNPDSSSTCTITGGCLISDFSNAVNSWNGAMGNVLNNDYHVKLTSPFHHAATDGSDIGANIDHINAVVAAVYPSFTWNPLVIATSSLTSCTHGTYCEQQLTISNGASGASGFVVWSITSGSLPSGMNFEGYGQNKVNGTYRTFPSSNSGWLWGTPASAGTFPFTFQAEDAAHQKTTVNLTLTVN